MKQHSPILAFVAVSAYATPFWQPPRTAEQIAAAKAEGVAQMREYAIENREALSAARALPGYNRINASFRFGHVRRGFINFEPRSLYVQLRSKDRRRLVDAAWWWNPLSGGEPSLAWPDFLSTYTLAERAASKHPWIAEWKRLPGWRSLEAHVVGTRIGLSEADLKEVSSGWKHARLAGEPAYCFLARRGRHSWVELVLNDADERTYVTKTSQEDSNPASPLDSLILNGPPNYGLAHQYAIIEADGRLTVHSTDEKSEGAPGEKP